MNSSKRVKLYMRSSIWNLDSEGNREGSAEVSCGEHDAALFSISGKTAVRFTESTEGGKITSEITFSPDCITVKKSGAIESVMVFKAGCDYQSLYSIPPFSFDMKISTKALKCFESDSGIEATVLYRMEIGGASKSCSMKISSELWEGKA